MVKSVERENTQLKARLANIEGDKQYLEQHVMELETKVGGLDLKNKGLEKEIVERLSRIEGDKQFCEQQLTELARKVGKLDEKCRDLEVKNRELENEVKMKRGVSVFRPQPGQPFSIQQPSAYLTGTCKHTETEFTMTDFEEYRRDNDIWYSPHFYTHPNGYKMCLKVFANGYGLDKGMHLTVCVCLMRGGFDDQLKWPFRGNITVKLVNQEQNEDHVVKIINFTSNTPEEYCERVMIEGQPGRGWGHGQFLSLSELQPKYLKNDCIKFCIKKVEIF